MLIRKCGALVCISFYQALQLAFLQLLANREKIHSATFYQLRDVSFEYLIILEAAKWKQKYQTALRKGIIFRPLSNLLPAFMMLPH